MIPNANYRRVLEKVLGGKKKAKSEYRLLQPPRSALAQSRHARCEFSIPSSFLALLGAVAGREWRGSKSNLKTIPFTVVFGWFLTK